MKETKEHYFKRLDALEKVTLEIVELQKQLESLRWKQEALAAGPDGKDMTLASSKLLMEWNKEWRQKKQKTS